MTTTAPGISLRSTSSRMTAPSRSSRADDRPICSGPSARGKPQSVIASLAFALLPASHGGHPFPRDDISFALAGPGRHRHRDRFERLLAVGAQLEVRPGRDADRDPRLDLRDLLALTGFAP